jgi:hypothetical protein
LAPAAVHTAQMSNLVLLSHALLWLLSRFRRGSLTSAAARTAQMSNYIHNLEVGSVVRFKHIAFNIKKPCRLQPYRLVVCQRWPASAAQ